LKKIDWRGNGKGGQPLRPQQSTTQVDSIGQGEGAWGLSRMAMAVGEVKAGGKGAGRGATYARRWGQ